MKHVRCILSVGVVFVLFAMVVHAQPLDKELPEPQTLPEGYSPKVIVITMFSWEQWLYLKDGIGGQHVSVAYEIPGLSHPMYCTEAQACVFVTEVGKTHAATSTMAVVKEPKLDVRDTYWFISGISGVPPWKGTLGSVGVNEWAIDVDLRHSAFEEETPASYPGETFLLGCKYGDPYCQDAYLRPTQVIHLNPRFVQWQYDLVKNSGVQLVSDERADHYKLGYDDVRAREFPQVRITTTVTGDDYFTGWLRTHEIQRLVANRMRKYIETHELKAGVEHFDASKETPIWNQVWLNDENTYHWSYTQMEDNATLFALLQGHEAGLVDFNRVSSWRSASNFSVPMPGQDVPHHMQGVAYGEMTLEEMQHTLAVIQAQEDGTVEKHEVNEILHSEEFQTTYESAAGYRSSGGFMPSLRNLHIPMTVVITEIITHWDQYKDQTP